MRTAFDIHLCLTLTAPYLVHGNDAGRYGLDATLLLNSEGSPVLPGTLVAGRVSETWLNLGSDMGNPDVERWFGRIGVTGAGGRRGEIHVDDLLLARIDEEPFTPDRFADDITRIRVDEVTGSVRPGALIVAEQVAAPGAKLEFEGIWQVWVEPEAIDCLSDQLRLALMLQTQIGAWRGIGFGRLQCVHISTSEHIASPLKLDPASPVHRLALTSRQPICVGSRSQRGNVFESDDVITGGTVLGALASMLSSRYGQPDLAKITDSAVARHFSRLRCTHALPSLATGERPVPLPQSLVEIAGELNDVWAHPKPPDFLTSAPAFQTDWKANAFQQAMQAQGWGVTGRHLRVRTDIDEKGKAKDSSLFAYDCVVARQDAQGQPLMRWLCDFDVASVPPDDRQLVLKELGELLALGLSPVGKTDARLQVERILASEPGSATAWSARKAEGLKTGETVPLLLVSDALLFATDSVARTQSFDLLKIYRQAFDNLLEKVCCAGAFFLSHFFATQRLEGGEYLFRRYQMGKSASYQPWVLTEAGSVFVIEIKKPKQAEKALAGWLAGGLPMPAEVTSAYGDTWNDHPYRRECGYGEIALQCGHPFYR